MFYRLISTVLTVAIVLPGVNAQESVTAERTVPLAPVRYDGDLLSAEFHRGRRVALMERLPANAVAVVFSAPIRNRDNDVDFEYRQSSDLYYLTGMTEPATVLVLAPNGLDFDGTRGTELLFVPPRDPQTEAWEGRRLGPERAGAVLGFENVASNEEFAFYMQELARRSDLTLLHQPLPTAVDPSSELGRQLEAFVRVANPLPIKASGRAARAVRLLLAVDNAEFFGRTKSFLVSVPAENFETKLLRSAREAFLASDTVDDWLSWRRENIDSQYADSRTLTQALTDLRSRKTPEEVALLQHAIDITVAAQKEAMKSIEPAMHEYEVEALIEYVFMRNGAEYPAFPSIVASGENSTILHYVSNRRKMAGNDMVVMDVGAEYHGYAADVTRTVPVDGDFSPEERAIYEIVLEAQKAGIAAAVVGTSFRAPHEVATRTIADGLIELEIIDDERSVRRFFNHGTSHYLGLSVHDVGSRAPLAPGTVLTVEPGIYIPPAADVDEKWWNIGVRIEDDILVTEKGPINMSAAAPRSVDEIELLMRERGVGNGKDGVLAGHSN